MAVAIPIISAFATIAEAGSIAAAVSTVGGFLSVAGGVLAGVGALSGNKDLTRLGGFLTLGSGVANLASAAGSAGGAAGSAADAAAEEGAKEAFRTSELTAANAAPLGQSTTSLAQTAQLRNATGSLPPVTEAPPVDPSVATKVADATPAAAPTLNAPGAAPASPAVPAEAAPPAVGAPAAPPATPGMPANGPIGSEYPNPVQPDQIAEAGRGMTQPDLQKYLSAAWDRTQGLLKNTSGFLRDNKELVSIVGNAFSPQAEQLDWQKSLYNRRRAALNSPVALGPRPTGA